MKRLCLGLSVLASLVATIPSLVAAPKLTSIVPASSPLVLHVRSISELRARWDETSYSRAWLDPEIRKFLAPSIEAMNESENGLVATIMKDTGMAPEEFFALFSGEAIFAVKDFTPYFRNQVAENPQMFLAVDCGSSSAKLREVIARASELNTKEGEKDVEEEFQGETIHVTLRRPGDESTEMVEREAWAIVDDVFLVGEPKSVVQEAIVAIKKGGVADSMTDHPAFASLYRKSPDTHLVMHLGLDGIVAPLVETLEATSGQTDENGNPTGPAASLARIGLTPKGLFHALGLDGLKSLDLSLAFRERETMIEGDFSWTERRGLLRVPAFGEPPVSRPDFVPDTWVYAGVDNFSLREAVDAIFATLADVSPMFEGMARQQLKNINTQIGIDVERDIIGSFGDVMVSGYALPVGDPAPGQPLDQFIAISLSNPDAFRGAIDGLLSRIPVGQMMESREYLGETIRSMSVPQGKSFAFSITRGYLLVSIGGPAMVESAIQGLQGGAARPFWKKAEVIGSLESLPEGASSVLVADLGRMMNLVVDFLATNAAGGGDESEEMGDEEDGGADHMPIAVDPEARPSPETIAKYWSMMSRGIYRSPNGFHLILKIDQVR